MSGRRSPLWAWLPVGAWLVVIFSLSSIPNLKPPELGLPIADKFAHFGEYSILGALYARARLRGTSWRRAALHGAVLGLAVGTLDELYQRGTPGRESSALDAGADLVGAFTGAMVWRRGEELWGRAARARGG